MTQDKLTESDIDMIFYFITEKGDVTRWVCWEEKKPLVHAQYPHLIDALERLRSADLTLHAIIRDMKAEAT